MAGVQFWVFREEINAGVNRKRVLHLLIRPVSESGGIQGSLHVAVKFVPSQILRQENRKHEQVKGIAPIKFDLSHIYRNLESSVGFYRLFQSLLKFCAKKIFSGVNRVWTGRGYCSKVWRGVWHSHEFDLSHVGIRRHPLKDGVPLLARHGVRHGVPGSLAFQHLQKNAYMRVPPNPTMDLFYNSNSQLIQGFMEITCACRSLKNYYSAHFIQNSPETKDFYLALIFQINRELPVQPLVSGVEFCRATNPQYRYLLLYSKKFLQFW